MKNQIYNPYMPLTEYVPDGEPHVFGDRVYIYGSHEEAGGSTYCSLPYTVWSAPVDDLTDWSNNGVSYTVEQDPHATPDRRQMYAPDCVQGKDGRYYLYYCLSGPQGVGGYWGPISVAVCDSPDGKFEYYGDVRNPDGTTYTRYVAFDPAVINDGGTVRLYYGTQMPFEDHMNFLNRRILWKMQEKVYRKAYADVSSPEGVMGAITVPLQDDMLTIASEPRRIAPTKTKDTPWQGHSFFEGSSIRKIGDTYYFIYSSERNHELCYATSKFPDRDFVYRGVIVSNGDIGYKGRTDKKRLNHTGNNHGSIENINDQWYVFYHRQTHGSDYSRQACAERITILPDGSILQAEMTSCGLNGGPLAGVGTYPAGIYCNLTNGKMPHATNRKICGDFPKGVQREGVFYLTNLSGGTWVGYKYFAFAGTKAVTLKCRCKGAVSVGASFSMNAVPQKLTPLPVGDSWQTVKLQPDFPSGTAPLYLYFAGKDCAELLEFTLE